MTHKDLKVDETQPSIDGWMIKQNEWKNKSTLCAYDGILRSLKKKGNSDICYKRVDLEVIMRSEIRQSQREKYDLGYMGELEESDS